MSKRTPEQSRAYYLANKARALAQQKAKRDAESPQEREARIAYHAAYYEKNKATLRAQQKAYVQANREQKVANRRSYYDRNKGREAAYMVEWRAKNPEKCAQNQRNHRARKRGAPGSHTPADVRRLFDLQRGMCAVCRCGLPKPFHVDHVQALSRGGSNDATNLQLLCGPCNTSKHAKDPIDFMQARGYLL